MHRRGFLAASGAALLAPGAWAGRVPGWEESFGQFLGDSMAAAHVPGMGVAIAREGHTPFCRGYGYAEVETARPVTADTVFQIASVSKTVTATAMMMLWQDGKFKLDDPVAPRLDFPLAHPKFPGTPITFRQLFTHTSAISDEVYGTLDFAKGAVPGLREFLAGYLVPGGRWYDAGKSFSAAQPGTVWSYSNVAAALLGYLAERVGGTPLDVLTRRRIFEPLGMSRTAWRYEGVAESRSALPYDFANARYKRVPRPDYPDWPAGLLCTSAADFAKFLTIYTNNGSVGGLSILKPETIALMLTPDPVLPQPGHPETHQGLIWHLRDWKGEKIASHNGGDPGSATVAVINPARQSGVLAFANITPSRPFQQFQFDVAGRLLERAGQIR